MSLPLEPLSELKTLQIVVTGYNAVPYVADVPVTVLEKPYLAWASRQLAEDSSGDGEPSPGDALATRLSLKNLGRTDAPTPSATVSSTSPCAVVDDGQLAWNTVAAGATGASVGTFRWHVTPDCANATRATFTAAWTAGGEHGSVRFSENIKAPALRLSGARLVGDDNGNGKPDPGETVTLAVTVANDGLLASHAGEISASTAAPSLQLVAPAAALGAIAPGQTAEARFEVRVAADAASDTVAQVAFVLGGASLTHDLTIGTPVVRLFESSEAVMIPDPGSTTASLAVPAGRVEAVRVQLDIAHTWVGDLKASVLAPDGTRVALHNATGGSQHDLVGWYPTDHAPAGDLGMLRGRPTEGAWQLELSDSMSPDSGTTRGWKLEILGYWP